jgi:hypothetical protein
MQACQAAKETVIGIEAFGRLALDPLDFGLFELGRDGPTTFAVSWSWRSKMSSSVPSNRSAHRCAPDDASMSCPAIRNLPADLRTLPSST